MKRLACWFAQSPPPPLGGRSNAEAIRPWRFLVAVGAIVLGLCSAAPVSGGGPAGCCVCTACSSPELFACRSALDANNCDTICTGLGCTTAQFSAGADCAAQPQCYGDCCDDLSNGCSQVPQGSCTGGKQFFANSFCDASNCIAQPPTATVTATGTVTDTPTASSTPTDTPNATPSETHTATPTITETPTSLPSNTPTSQPTDTATVAPTDTATVAPTDTATVAPTDTATSAPTDTVTHAPTDTATRTPTHTPTLPPTHTATPAPTDTATEAPTPTATLSADDSFAWLIDRSAESKELIGIPIGGATYRQGGVPALSLLDAMARFCSTPGLLPQLHLDAVPDECQNNCFLGIYPNVQAGEVEIAHLPAISGERRTYDLLIETPLGCAIGHPPTTLRMANAIKYTRCVADCDGNGVTQVNEIVLGVTAVLGDASVSACRAADRSGDGTITINELIAAVRSLLLGCGPEP